MAFKQYRVVVEAISESEPHGRVTISHAYTPVEIEAMAAPDKIIGDEARRMFRQLRDVVDGELA